MPTEKQSQPIERFVIMGSSSGGQEALEYLIPQLKLNESSTVFIMPHIRTKTTYQNLKKNGIEVVGVAETTDLEPGKIYLAAHTFFDSENLFRHGYLNEIGIVFSHSIQRGQNIDRMMEGAAEFYKEKCMGVVLSGFGDDGADGLNRISELGGVTLVQLENGSLQDDDASDAVGNYVSEMPENARDLTDVDFSISIQKMASVLNSYMV